MTHRTAKPATGSGFLKTAAARTALAAAVILGVAACTDPFPPGPDGTVVSRDIRYSPATKTNWYYLTVRPSADGAAEKEFRVPSQDYFRCKPQTTYPAC